jgi:hypothetical protein
MLHRNLIASHVPQVVRLQEGNKTCYFSVGDGSVVPWGPIMNESNHRIGLNSSFVSWRNSKLFRNKLNQYKKQVHCEYWWLMTDDKLMDDKPDIFVVSCDNVLHFSWPICVSCVCSVVVSFWTAVCKPILSNWQ